MLRKIWKILWISVLSFIVFIIVLAVLVSIFVPEPPPIEYKTVDWTRTPDEQGLKVGDWIKAQGHLGGFIGASKVFKGDLNELPNIDPLSGQYFLVNLQGTVKVVELNYDENTGDVIVASTEDRSPLNHRIFSISIEDIPNHAQQSVIKQLNLLQLHKLESITEIIVTGRISEIPSPYEFKGYPPQYRLLLDNEGSTLEVTATSKTIDSAIQGAVTSLPPPINYKTIDWTLTPEGQGLKFGDWIEARGRLRMMIGASGPTIGKLRDLPDIDPLSGQYLLRRFDNYIKVFEVKYFGKQRTVRIKPTASNSKITGVRLDLIPNHAQQSIIKQLNLLKLHDMEHITDIIIRGQIAQMIPMNDKSNDFIISLDNEAYTFEQTATPEEIVRAMEQAKANAAAVMKEFKQLKSQFIGEQHWNTMEFVQSRMHNPKSFKHVRTTFTTNEAEKYRIIKMTYRGTNLYNAIVTNTIRVKVDMDGNVIEVLSDR